jgi:hypothetical protein
MPNSDMPPHFVRLEDLQPQLLAKGYAALAPDAVAAWAGVSLISLCALQAYWQDMPSDAYLKDGGRYRRRRHSSFVFKHEQLHDVPHRAHWQPTTYNALHGGMNRWFEPIASSLQHEPTWQRLLSAFARCAVALQPLAHRNAQQCIEAHQFRIETVDGIGRPTPEGAHRDGVDLVAVFLLARHQIKGGETRVFEAQGRSGERFTLQAPWSLLLLVDDRVVHESTPIQPTGADLGYRDTLVLSAKQGSFLDSEAQPA